MSSTTGIYNSLEPTYNPDANKREPNKTLGKDDFLKLMIVQMQNQDPLNPMDNTEQLAQQAQFSSLEQMQNVNTNLEKLLGQFEQNERSAVLSMVGKAVTGFRLIEDEQTGETQQESFEGFALGADFSSGVPSIIVQTENGEFRVPQLQITEVREMLY
jgi:flagellar basal-body rod modification protein FlgD